MKIVYDPDPRITQGDRLATPIPATNSSGPGHGSDGNASASPDGRLTASNSDGHGVSESSFFQPLPFMPIH